MKLLHHFYTTIGARPFGSLVVLMLCFGFSSCCLFRNKDECTYFKSFLCASNSTYECYIPIPDSCTMTSTAVSTEIEGVFLSTRMKHLVENLVYAHLRSIESANVSHFKKEDGMRFLPGTSLGKRSKALPEDFSFDGVLCSEYDVKIVPFKVVNAKENLFLEEAMAAFYHCGRFCFALYVLLNDCTVSFDFKRGTKSSLLLYNVATYPFLERDEYWVQRKRIMEWSNKGRASQIECMPDR